MGKVSTTDMEYGFSNLQGCWKQGFTCLWGVGVEAGKFRESPGKGKAMNLGARKLPRAISSNPI